MYLIFLQELQCHRRSLNWTVAAPFWMTKKTPILMKSETLSAARAKTRRHQTPPRKGELSPAQPPAFIYSFFFHHIHIFGEKQQAGYY